MWCFCGQQGTLCIQKYWYYHVLLLVWSIAHMAMAAGIVPLQLGFAQPADCVSNALRRGLQCRTTNSAPETHGWWLLCERHLTCTNKPFAPSSVPSGTPLTVTPLIVASTPPLMSSCVSIGHQHSASWRRDVRQFSACPKGGNDPGARHLGGYDVARRCRNGHATSSSQDTTPPGDL